MRDRQKARTRQSIVNAAGRLLSEGGKPGLDEISAAAGVSRATAYRYFPGLDALLSEAAVDLLVPDAETLFAAAPADPRARVLAVDDAFDSACREQDAALRLMLARMLEASLDRTTDDPPLRQNRRGPMLDTALAPLRDKLGASRFALLVDALTMIVGTEGYLALKDVAGLDADRARKVRRWAIDALVAAALA